MTLSFNILGYRVATIELHHHDQLTYSKEPPKPIDDAIKWVSKKWIGKLIK